MHLSWRFYCSCVSVRAHSDPELLPLLNIDILSMQAAAKQQDLAGAAAEETADTNTDADATEGAEEEQDAADGNLTSVAQLQQLTKVPAARSSSSCPCVGVADVL
jgi:hypothetical protein